MTYDQYVIASGSLFDQTEEVSSKDGTVNISFPSNNRGQSYRVFSFYQRLSGNKNLVFTAASNSSAQNSIFDNGSYVVDHFDAKGAETVINFWEEHMLVDGVREQLQRVGHYGKSQVSYL